MRSRHPCVQKSMQRRGLMVKFPAQAEQGIPSGVSGNPTFGTGNLSGDQGTEGTSFDQGGGAVLHSIYSSAHVRLSGNEHILHDRPNAPALRDERADGKRRGIYDYRISDRVAFAERAGRTLDMRRELLRFFLEPLAADRQTEGRGDKHVLSGQPLSQKQSAGRRISTSPR